VWNVVILARSGEWGKSVVAEIDCKGTAFFGHMQEKWRKKCIFMHIFYKNKAYRRKNRTFGYANSMK